MSLIKENCYKQLEENIFPMLIKSEEDLMLIENYLKNRKLELLKYNILFAIKEKFLKLIFPLFSIILIIFSYYFFIFVNKFLLKKFLILLI
jgi:hypothetical protein